MGSDEVDVSGYINSDVGETIPIEAPYRSGATSMPYILRVSGRQFFMKKLRAEYVGCVQYRNLFKKEFEVGKSINHQNIVNYEALHDEGGDIHILMEYISGATLEQKVVAMPWYFTKRANLDRFFIQLLSGLDYLHKKHIVHCDLTPRNIMFTRVNDDVKIIDLGFCYCDSFYNTAGRTYTFAAPEQKRTDTPIDARTDIYALGKLLEYIDRNIEGKLPRVYKNIMERALESEPEKRFSNCGEILEILRKRSRVKSRVIVGLVALPFILLSALYCCKTEWFYRMSNDLMWILKPVDYDVNVQMVYYKITSDSTCAVVGCGLIPNPMIDNEIVFNSKIYKVTEIVDKAFYRAAHIKSVYIPFGVQRIGKETFHKSDSIVSLELPNSVVETSFASFARMRSLQKVKLSGALTAIPRNSFAFCERLTDVYIPEGVVYLGVDAFAWDSCLVNVSLPSTLEIIDRGVFWYCRSLTAITIPSNVKRIGDYCFYYCDALTDIYMLPIVPPEVCAPFKHTDDITIHVPKGCADAYRASPGYADIRIVDDIAEQLPPNE